MAQYQHHANRTGRQSIGHTWSWPAEHDNVRQPGATTSGERSDRMAIAVQFPD
jgi:hypothetical protein